MEAVTGHTPLHWASLNDRRDAVVPLLEGGADVTAADIQVGRSGGEGRDVSAYDERRERERERERLIVSTHIVCVIGGAQQGLLPMHLAAIGGKVRVREKACVRL